MRRTPFAAICTALLATGAMTPAAIVRPGPTHTPPLRDQCDAGVEPNQFLELAWARLSGRRGVRAPAAPSNDHCSTPMLLELTPSVPLSITQDTSEATSSPS